MPLGPLSGFTVAVTADRRSEEQASLLARRGAEVLHGPVIKTLPLGDEGGTRQATLELIADPPDVVILSTALGVRGWFSAAAGLGLEEELLAVFGGAELVARGHQGGGRDRLGRPRRRHPAAEPHLRRDRRHLRRPAGPPPRRAPGARGRAARRRDLQRG